MNKYPSIIAGEEVFTSKTLAVTNPYNNSPFAEVCVSGKAELEAALSAVSRGFSETANLCTLHRVGILEKARKLLSERSEEFAQVICAEVGKTIREARTEVSRGMETLRLSAIAAEEYMGGEILSIDAAPNGSGKWGFAQRFPAGPVLAITPFNFPLNLVLHKLGPAVAAGNPFILKPASKTPISGIMIGKLFADAGYPARGVNVLIGSGAEIAEPAASDSRIKVVTFTGSPPVGERLAKIAGMKHIALELGSNSGVYVHNDADIICAADKIVKGAFALAGQVCISTQRVYAHKEIFSQLADLIVTGTRAIKVGDPADEATEMGPMISSDEAERVEKWIVDAVRRGAKILTGGSRNGLFIEPTVLTNVPRDCDISCKEAFGPVLILEPVLSADEGIRAVGDSQYGLQAGIFTNDLELARSAFKTLDVGGVIINDVPTFRADLMPYGGNRLSGIGREGPRWALEHMTVWKAFVVQ